MKKVGRRVMKKKIMDAGVLLPEGQEPVHFRPGESVLEALLRAKVRIPYACGGMGSCGTCRIEVLSDKELPERNELEAERAQELGFAKKVRLACQLSCTDQLSFRIPRPPSKAPSS